MIDRQFALEFAGEWVRAWNAHDLEAILSHYSNDFEMTSPFIPSVTGGTATSLKGKDAVGKYWISAFERLLDVLISVDSLVIYYRSVMSKMAAEIMIFGEENKVVKSIAHYDEV